MPKKPLVATADELQEEVAKLVEQIKKVQVEAAAAVQVVDKKWQAAVEEVTASVTHNANTASESVTTARSEAKEYTEACVSALNEQLIIMFPPIEEKIVENQEEMLKRLEDVDTKIQQLIVDELSALAAQFDEELQSVKTELSQNIEDMGREAAEALVQQRREIDESIEKLRVETIEDRARIREEMKLEFEKTIAAQNIVDQKQDEEREALRIAKWAQFAVVDEVIKDKENKAHVHAEEVAATAEANRAALAEYNRQRLVQLDGETAQLREGLREVENVSTRRVEWVIKNAAEMIRPPPEGWSAEKSYRSFQSPKFNGAGAWGMQFELQFFAGRRKSAVEEAKDPGRNEGNLALHLWACKGTRLAFKAFIGDRAMPLDKKFNGLSPASTGRMCWLNEAINKEDGTLRVGVEFLEAMREVEYPSRMPPPPLSLTGKAPEEIDGVMKAIAALAGEEEEKEPDENSLPGSMCYMRHLSNRVMEQVKEQVSGMESRMIRKIQWLVQNASKLREHFQWGQAMCSPCFSAAGVENMQFALYPSGYGQITEGFCSLFLYANAGVTLHCFLSMGAEGKQAREVQHTWDKPGAYGRTNFCLFDKVVDLQDDTILITLEIEEAKQEVCTPWTHQESAKGVATDKDLSSIVKLTRNPGKTPNGRPNGRQGKMDTEMTLQSIWISKSFVEQGQASSEIPEGFHSFDEVLNRRPMTIRPESADKKMRKSATRLSRHESAPALKSPSAQQNATRISAMQEDLAPPLPPVSAGPSITLGAIAGSWGDTVGSELPGGASNFGKVSISAARRQRPDSSGSGSAAARFGGTA